MDRMEPSFLQADSTNQPLHQSSKKKLSSFVVAPDGEILAPGEAVKRGLVKRASCERCRKRKLKCLLTEDGDQCQKCSQEQAECIFSTRSTIGRPPKSHLDGSQSESKPNKRRKTQNQASHPPPSILSSSQHQGPVKNSIPSPRNSLSPLYSRSISNPPTNQHDPRNNSVLASFQVHPSFQQHSSVSSPYASATPFSSATELSFFPSPNLSHSTADSNPDSSNTLNENFTSNQQSPSSSTTAASLSDLSLAAYLETLDTVDLSYADGLTENMVDSQSMMLTEGLSYAVPSDFSWWDLNLVDSLTQNANSNLSASQVNSSYDHLGSEGFKQSGGNGKSWPRGMEAGMGQGEITTAEGLVIKSQGWSQQQEQDPEAEVKVPTSSSSKKEADFLQPSSCCCSKTKTKTETEAETETSVNKKSKNNDHEGQVSTHLSQKRLEPPNSMHPAPFPPIKQERSSSPSRVHCVPNPTGNGCLCQHDGNVALLSIQRSLRETAQNQEVDSNSTPSQKSKAQAKTLHLTLCTSQAVSASCACSADCQTCRNDPSVGTSASLLVATSLQIYARAVHILREGFGRPSTNSSGSRNGINLSGGLDVKIGDYRPGHVNARQIALFAMKLELRDLRSALGKIAEMARSRMRDETTSQKVERVNLDELKQVAKEGKGKGKGKGKVQGQEADHVNGITGAPDGNSGSSVDANNQSQNQNQNQNQNPKEQGLSPIDELVITKLYSQLGDLLKTIEALT